MAETLKDVIRRAHRMRETAHLPVDHEDKVHPPFVLPLHDEWMSRPESERLWTPEAIQFASDVFTGKYKHPRTERISPSALGDSCERMLLLGFGGHAQVPFPKSNQEKMDEGSFAHLRWQMEGLSAGYMTAGEVWVHSDALRCGGSADARLVDGSLFELKRTSSHLFMCARELLKPVRDQQRHKFRQMDYFLGMHAKHKIQMEAYWEVDRVAAEAEGRPRIFSDWGSLIYQNSGDPSEIVEFRVRSSPKRRQEANRILEGLHDWIDLNELPDMLDGCARVVAGEPVTDKELTVFNRCSYRDSCPMATTVRLS